MNRPIDDRLYFQELYIGQDIEDFQLEVQERFLASGHIEWCGGITFTRRDGDVFRVTFPLSGEFGRLILQDGLSKMLISLQEKHGQDSA